MSFKYARAGVYYCDTPGCNAKEFSPTGEQPEGWTDRVLEWTRGDEIVDFITRHYCDKCLPPEAKP